MLHRTTLSFSIEVQRHQLPAVQVLGLAHSPRPESGLQLLRDETYWFLSVSIGRTCGATASKVF